jgi:thiol-disulfide isomerase/thioredoxin
MKKIILLLSLVLVSCNLESPKEFSKEALQEKIFALDDSSSTLEEIISQHKGKKILIDVWASWCRDCIKGFPALKNVQKEFPEVVYLFLSVDTKKSSWKYGINKYNLKGEHYNLPKGMKKGELVIFLNLGWIPRYLVIDENGKIQLFKATQASDSDISDALKTAI